MFRNNSECYGTLWTTCTHGKVDHFPFSLRIQSWSYTQFSKHPSFDWIAWLRRCLLCPLALIWVVILVRKIFLSPQLGLSSFLYICLVLFIHWVIAHFRVFSSVTRLCPTLCDPMASSTPGLPVHHQVLELTQTHVHQVGDVIHHLILCCSLLFLPSIFPSIRVFSNESSYSHQVAKVLEFQLQHQCLQWIFRTDFLYNGLVGSLC